MKGMDTARVEMVSPKGLDLQERVIEINRVAKVVKGGRRFSFTALVAVGDEESVVGIGYGKAREVPLAIQKAVDNARKNLIQIPKYGDTITHKIIGRFGAGHVVLRPASAGTGVIAGGGVRAVLELGGVKDVLTKSIGTQNPINLVKATMDGIVRLRRPEEVAELRGLTISEVLGIEKEPEAEGEDGGGADDEASAAAVEQAADAAATPDAAAPTPKPRLRTLKPPRLRTPLRRRCLGPSRFGAADAEESATPADIAALEAKAEEDQAGQSGAVASDPSTIAPSEAEAEVKADTELDPATEAVAEEIQEAEEAEEDAEAAARGRGEGS